MMLKPSISKNDLKAKWLIGIFSVVVFLVVVSLSKIQVKIDLGFDIHIFALINSIINGTVSILLIAALVVVKQKKFELHKKIMLTALTLSVVFLVSYILHHILAGDTKFGDTNHNMILEEDEINAVGAIRYIYYGLLLTHIFLAAIILPFILWTAYRGLTSEFSLHKKIARISWPLWLYVSITGVLVYIFISPYYV